MQRRVTMNEIMVIMSAEKGDNECRSSISRKQNVF